MGLGCYFSTGEKYIGIEGVDIFVGTPFLEIKPYIPDIDVFSGVDPG
jgi:tRNA (Thr-GGU) A37 N-methylase